MNYEKIQAALSAPTRVERVRGPQLEDLKRCEHGRNRGDNCFGCEGGVSLGNPFLKKGQVIGYTMYRQEILVP
ncbi:hypothetical protein ACWIG4_30215 [Streptomyces sp. NPDC002248]